MSIYTNEKIEKFIEKFDLYFSKIDSIENLSTDQDQQVARVIIDGKQYVFYAEDFVGKTIKEVKKDLQGFLNHSELSPVSTKHPAVQQYYTESKSSEIANRFQEIAKNPELLNSIQPSKNIKKPFDVDWHKFVIIDAPFYIFLFSEYPE